MKGFQFLTIWYVENMQIRSRDLLKSKNLSCEMGNTFLSLLNLGLNSMILGLVDTSFLRLMSEREFNVL